MSEVIRLGKEVDDWVVPEPPTAPVLLGTYTRLERLSADAHAAEIHRSNSVDDSIWDFLPYGPFTSAAGYHRWIRDVTASDDQVFYAIKNLETGHFEGVASYLRINPNAGSIEVGNINYSKPLQRSRAATEAMFLMMHWAFEAGYRRYEWKCNALNMGSRRAAERFGFSYEGIFRQAAVVKGRNRDTAWYASIDSEWPALKLAFTAWLSPDNFDQTENQKERLSDLTRLVRVVDDPAL